MTARCYIGAGQGDESEKTYPSGDTLTNSDGDDELRGGAGNDDLDNEFRSGFDIVSSAGPTTTPSTPLTIQV